MAQVIECLPTKLKVLSSNPITAQKRGGEQEEAEMKEGKEKREGKEEELSPYLPLSFIVNLKLFLNNSL
jgi:hypothetical protein